MLSSLSNINAVMFEELYISLCINTGTWWTINIYEVVQSMKLFPLSSFAFYAILVFKTISLMVRKGDKRVSHNQGYHLVCTWGQK